MIKPEDIIDQEVYDKFLAWEILKMLRDPDTPSELIPHYIRILVDENKGLPTKKNIDLAFNGLTNKYHSEFRVLKCIYSHLGSFEKGDIVTGAQMASWHGWDIDTFCDCVDFLSIFCDWFERVGPLHGPSFNIVEKLKSLKLYGA